MNAPLLALLVATVASAAPRPDGRSCELYDGQPTKPAKLEGGLRIPAQEFPPALSWDVGGETLLRVGLKYARCVPFLDSGPLGSVSGMSSSDPDEKTLLEALKIVLRDRDKSDRWKARMTGPWSFELEGPAKRYKADMAALLAAHDKPAVSGRVGDSPVRALFYSDQLVFLGQSEQTPAVVVVRAPVMMHRTGAQWEIVDLTPFKALGSTPRLLVKWENGAATLFDGRGAGAEPTARQISERIGGRLKLDGQSLDKRP